MFKKTVALLMTTGLMVGLGACGTDEVAVGKKELKRRGFANVERVDSRTSSDIPLDDVYFDYFVSYKSCRVRIIYDSTDKDLTWFPEDGGITTAGAVYGVSVKKLNEETPPELKNC